MMLRGRLRAIRCVLPVALVITGLLPSPVVADAPASIEVSSLEREIASRVNGNLRPFYASRGYRPLWTSPAGRWDPAVAVLLRKLDGASLDAIASKKLKLRALQKALRKAGTGQATDIARAELLLSQTFARYMAAMRAAPRGTMSYESPALAPAIPTPAAALQAAAGEKSLARYIETMGWMHPFYAPMRDALVSPRVTPEQRAIVWRNLERVRALPATAAKKYVLIDAASARLWMYEDGKPVDSMRVVVGKAASPTPIMSGFLRYAITNPFWNVPPDLVRNAIAPNVLDKGCAYLEAEGYEVLSDWSADPERIDPMSVDWTSVASGIRQLRVRQLPGGRNFMGKAKFEFPNSQGIYLHDTPDKNLLQRTARQLSNGCVRLEDADRFGRWLLGRKLPVSFKSPERRIELPQLVPIYITYLTALPEKNTIVFNADAYRHDEAATRLAHAN